MNPLLYKAHPLLYLTVDLLVHPAAHTLDDFSTLVLFYLTVNLIWTACLRGAVKAGTGFVVAYGRAYWMALPSLVCLIPLTLTLLADILIHSFKFADRYILIVAIMIAVQMLGAFYGALVKHPTNARPIGLQIGLMVASTLLLLSLPFGLLLLGLNAWLKVV
jgi:hypothetical protein